MAEASSIAKPSWTLEAARVRLPFATQTISPLPEFALNLRSPGACPLRSINCSSRPVSEYTHVGGGVISRWGSLDELRYEHVFLLIFEIRSVADHIAIVVGWTSSNGPPHPIRRIRP